MAKAPTTFIPTSGTALARTADSLSFPFANRPQALTLYLRMVELAPAASALADAYLVYCGGTGNGRFYLRRTGGVYRIVHATLAGSVGTSLSTVSVAVGDTVEIVAWLSGTGSVNLSASVNGATATTGTASAALPIADSWGTAKVYLTPVATTIGAIGVRDVVIVRGTLSLQAMRLRAGVE